MSPTSSDSVPRALARLLHHRWALPVLAQVSEMGGCKFVTLHRRLGVAPVSLKRALARLEMLDLVVPNSGYGHPMRPEYVLGDLGCEVATPAEALWGWMRREEVERAMLKKWSLPTFSAVGLGAQRFGEIVELLGVATPRSTTLALKELIAIELATRRVDDGFPPTPRYRPAANTHSALEHVRALGESLARCSG